MNIKEKDVLKLMVIVNLVIMVLNSLVRADFEGESEGTIIQSSVSPKTKKLVSMPKEKNPVFLDAKRYKLLPLSSVTIFRAPGFENTILPPGTTSLLISEATNRADNTVYSVNGYNLVKEFPGFDETKEECNGKRGSKRPCPPGYTKVTLEEGESDPKKKKTDKPEEEKPEDKKDKKDEGANKDNDKDNGGESFEGSATITSVSTSNMSEKLTNE